MEELQEVLMEMEREGEGRLFLLEGDLLEMQENTNKAFKVHFLIIQEEESKRKEQHLWLNRVV